MLTEDDGTPHNKTNRNRWKQYFSLCFTGQRAASGEHTSDEIPNNFDVLHMLSRSDKSGKSHWACSI